MFGCLCISGCVGGGTHTYFELDVKLPLKGKLDLQSEGGIGRKPRGCRYYSLQRHDNVFPPISAVRGTRWSSQTAWRAIAVRPGEPHAPPLRWSVAVVYFLFFHLLCISFPTLVTLCRILCMVKAHKTIV